MPLSTPVLAVAGIAAGAVAAVVAYQAGTSTPADAAASTPDAAAVTRTPTVTPTPSRRVVWKDCEKGTHLRRGTCVRVKRKVVVVEDPAPAVAAPAPVEQQVAAPVAPVAPARPHATRSTSQHAASGQTRDDGQDGHAQPADLGTEHHDGSADQGDHAVDDHGSEPAETPEPPETDD